jgi:uncharacterized protein (DUF2141 family)
MRLISATAGATLLLAASAHAAYAPKLQVSIEPTRYAQAPAVTSVITQAAGETASKTVKVTFPKGFEANFGAKPAICPPADEENNACKPESQIGTASATASVLGLPQQLDGTVHYGGPAGTRRFKLIVILRNQLLGDQRIIGIAELVPSGGSVVTFDNLPDVLTTSFKLALQGGDKSLLKNPNTCGTFTLTAEFTSQQGEKGTGSAPVEITGCPPARKPDPKIRAVALRRSGTVTFTLSEAARGRVTVKRDGRKVASRAFNAPAGPVSVKTRRLQARRYTVAISARTADGRFAARRLRRLAGG